MTSCDKNETPITVLENAKQDILTFNTNEEFTAALSKVNAMNNTERLTWEKSKGFKSFGTICNEVYQSIDPTKFKNLQEVKDTVAALSNFLEINQNQNGELYVDTKECINPARYLMNEDKMYIIGTKVFKQFDKKLVSENICNVEKLRNMKACDVSDKSEVSKVKQRLLPSGYITGGDLWGPSKIVSGQKYVIRVVIDTQSDGNFPSSLRRDRYSFYNYKWTLWIYWGDYLTTATSHIITRTAGYDNFNYSPSAIHRATYDNSEHYVKRTYYATCLDYRESFYLYYKINVTNSKGCILNAEYGTDYIDPTFGYN